MAPTQSSMSYDLIKNNIMKEKQCTFEFKLVDSEMVEKMLLNLSDDTSPGIDNIDGNLLRVSARCLSVPICHIFNCCLTSSVFPALWKESKVIPLPKDKKVALSGSSSRPISLLPVPSKLLERLVFSQVQHYFLSNELIAKISTCKQS